MNYLQCLVQTGGGIGGGWVHPVGTSHGKAKTENGASNDAKRNEIIIFFMV